MKKHIIAILTGICLSSSAQITYANPNQTEINTQQSVTTTTKKQIETISDTKKQVSNETVQNNVSIETVTISQKELKATAGVLPGTILYKLERYIEALKLAITSIEEKLAALKAQYAVERAAEAAMLIENGQAEMADKAAEEYMDTLASAAEHLNKDIELKDEAVETMNNFTEAFVSSQAILQVVLDKAPEDAKEEVKALVEKTKNLFKKAMEHVEEPNEKIAELLEQEDDVKVEAKDKEIIVDVKARNELKIAEERTKEELRKQLEKIIEEKKKAEKLN